MTEELEIRRRKAAYRAAHRGTKEMDWLLGRYASAKLETMTSAELTEFEAFMALPDPQLQRWLIDPATLDQETYRRLVVAMRGFHGL